MPLTVAKVRRNALFLEEAFHSSKKRKGSRLYGVFADVGRKLAKENKSSVDLVREIRDV